MMALGCRLADPFFFQAKCRLGSWRLGIIGLFRFKQPDNGLEEFKPKVQSLVVNFDVEIFVFCFPPASPDNGKSLKNKLPKLRKTSTY